MALGSADVIRERAAAQGIGASPLVGQAVQRRDIEQTKSLSQAIATSRATLAQVRQERQAKFVGAVAKNRAAVTRQLNQPRQQAGPGITLRQTSSQQGEPIFSIGGPLGSALPAQRPNRIEAISQFLKAQLGTDVPITIEEIGQGDELRDLRSRLQAAFPTATLTPLTSRPVTKGLGFKLGGGRRRAPVVGTARPTDANALLNLSTKKNQLLKQNESAKVVSAGLRQFTARAASTSATSQDVGLRDRLLNAMQVGQGFKFLQEFSRLGGQI